MSSSSGRNPTKTDRAKHAHEMINKTIPALLRAHLRARRGVEAAELLVGLPPPCNNSNAGPATFPNVRVVDTDTLTAAAELRREYKRTDRIAILSMASPLRPGGGLLSGATSQEESLCARTTLFASLRDEWYRLPDEGVVYSPDVLVVDGLWYTDVISCAAVRCPVLSKDNTTYTDPRDRDGMRARMLQVMRTARSKGIQALVLGALGCGAYGNPPEEVAALWRSVVFGTRRRPAENWDVKDIIFAIKANGKQGRRKSSLACHLAAVVT